MMRSTFYTALLLTAPALSSGASVEGLSHQFLGRAQGSADLARETTPTGSKEPLKVLSQHGYNFGARLPLIPYPASVKMGRVDAKPFVLSNFTGIELDGSVPSGCFAVKTLNSHLSKITGSKDVGGTVSLIINPSTVPDKEGYHLEIDKLAAKITAADTSGLLYGVQTFKQLTSNGKVSLPSMIIKDFPRFPWRGLHLDVSRHFHSVDEIKKLLDTMCAFKLNHFHWHLTDDQGWRLPIDEFPKLTQLGAQSVTGQQQSYTKDEIKNVVAYAAERAIEVLPEIDVPGHSRAALAAYPEYGNVDVNAWTAPRAPMKKWGVDLHTLAPTPKTLAFLGSVFGTVTDLFPGNLVHVGGDEASDAQWSQSLIAKHVVSTMQLEAHNPSEKMGMKIQGYFMQGLDHILRPKGRAMVAWDEIMGASKLPKDTVIMAWRSGGDGQNLVDAVRQGHRAINARGDTYYFDRKQSDASNEPAAFGNNVISLQTVYDRDPVPERVKDDILKNRIMGVQGQLWSEFFPTWSHVEYMAHPRSLALAERAWTPNSQIDNFEEFKLRLRARLPDLDSMGVNYRKLDSDRT